MALFPLSEVALGIFKRARLPTSVSHDRGSMVTLWLVVFLSSGAAIVAQRFVPGRFPFALSPVYLAALILLVLGLALRWAAILTLGRFFTVNVVIHLDHRIVQTGPYRLVRHPSYAGLFLAFVGLGLAFANWLSLVILVVPIFIAFHSRIVLEERALREAFGAEYEAYCARTARVLPGIY
jgi:protein-S-isoprenylcysteine O-methyltransferase Ste14